MAATAQKIPGPDHPITIEPNPSRVVVSLDGQTIADSRNVLTLREASYPPVLYIPRTDVDMSLLEQTDHTTRCPYKGNASYYTIVSGERRLDNAVWSYETPYDSVAGIKEHLAFYPDRVDIVETLV